MIANEEKEGWHYLAVKNLSYFLRGRTSKHHSYFCCLNFLNYFATKIKLEYHEKVCKKEDFCGVVSPTQQMIYHNLINT